VRGAVTAGSRPGVATSTTSSVELHGLTQAHFITECNSETPEREKPRSASAGVAAAWSRAPRPPGPTPRPLDPPGPDRRGTRCGRGAHVVRRFDRRPCVRSGRRVEQDRLPGPSGRRLGSP
jgi:hypothetical protein